MLNELRAELISSGAAFIKMADISSLPRLESLGYRVAVLVGVVFSFEYLTRAVENAAVDRTGFYDKEMESGQLAEKAADFLIERGFDAFALTQQYSTMTGLYDAETKTSVLPHKKIAVLAGLGWIGKNNLLVTAEYGCAFCMSAVLTNAPLPVKEEAIITPKCGDCTICLDACPRHALTGATWEIGIRREAIMNINECDFCLKCLANCPWTQKYAYKR